MAKLNPLQKLSSISFIIEKIPFLNKKGKKAATDTPAKKGAAKKGFTKPSIPGRLLVLETTGFELRGVVAKSTPFGGFQFSTAATSSAANFNDAAGEVLDKLRAESKRKVPKKAVLITPCCASDLLYLPVDPKNKKAVKQISEMVRWELEELFVSQNDIWSLGALLMGRGKITPAQRMEIEDAASGRGSLNAAYEQYASRDDIDQCLEIQEQVLGEDGELLPGAVALADDEQYDQFTWWGGGINESVCSQWTTALQKNGVQLKAVYPQLGAGLPILAGEKKGWILVDIRQEQYGLYQGKEGRLKSSAFHSRTPGPVDLAELGRNIRSILHTDTETIYVCAAPEFNTHLEELAEELRCPVVLLSQDTMFPGLDECGPESSAALYGTALHALGRVKSFTLVGIQAQQGRPPVWKNKELWPWAGLAVLLVAVVCGETYLRKQADEKEWALELIQIEYKKRTEMKTQVQQTVQETNELKRQLMAKEEELEKAKHFRNILNNVIYYRQELAPGILDVVRKAVNEYVMIDLLEESNDRQGFYLEGWAVNDTHGQIFITQLNKMLTPLKYKVLEMQLVKGAGPFGMEGFGLKIWLTKSKLAAGAVK